MQWREGRAELAAGRDYWNTVVDGEPIGFFNSFDFLADLHLRGCRASVITAGL